MRFQWNRAVLALVAVLGIMAGAARGQEKVSESSPDEKVTFTYNKVIVERETRVKETEVKVRERKVKPVYVAAIFVKNRAQRVPDEKVLVVQDFMNGHLNGKGFKIINREDAINKVADFATEGPNKGDRRLVGEKLDELLSNNTSALRLADNLGADYILTVSVTQYGRDAVRIKDAAREIDLTTVTHKLRLTYTLLDTTVGGSLTSGIATATFVDRFQPGTEIIRENTLDDLLEAASADLSNMMATAAKGDAIPGPDTMAGAKKEVPFSIYCAVADLTVPEVIKNDKGQYVVTSGSVKVQPLAFTVELDGTVIGSTNIQTDQDGRPIDAPNFSARPGLHKMRIRREMFKDWEGTVNIRENLRLTVAMVMTREGLDQFLGLGKEFNQWKKEQILSEMQMKAYDAFLKQLEKGNMRLHDKPAGMIAPAAGDAPRRPTGVNINVDIQNSGGNRNAEKAPAKPQEPARPTGAAPAPAKNTEEPTVDPALLPGK